MLLYRLCQWLWGFPQTLAGFVLGLFVSRTGRSSYRGAVVMRWKLQGSLSLGMYIFLSDSVTEDSMVLLHEYGHTIQSMLLGPLYLLVIGLPSLLWAGLPAFEAYRRKKSVGYYSFYTERWANYLVRAELAELEKRKERI